MVFISVPFNTSQIPQLPKNLLFIHNVNILVIVLSVIFFDLADFVGYEALHDSFLRSQSHGPLALCEGGIIAWLAREVLPNSYALSGPSSEALNGHHAQFICDDKIYVDDDFLDVELGLICSTYVLGNTNAGGNEYSFLSTFQLSCY